MGLRILLAVDESDFSTAAAAVAVDLFRRIDGSELTALHVVNVVPASGNIVKDLPGRLGFEPAVVSSEVSEQHDDAGRKVLAAVKERAKDVGRPVRTVLEHGAVIDRIVHWASPFDLLVMGIRGETEQRFEGQGGASMHNVLEQISVPVLLVPRNQDRLGRVAIGYDGSEGARHAVQGLEVLASRLSLDVHAVYVTGDGKGGDVLNEVDEQLTTASVTHHVLTSTEEVHEALARHAHDNACDTLALGFKGNSPLKDFLFGSSTEYICQNTDLALYIAH